MTMRHRILSIIPYQVYPAHLGGEKGIAVFNQYLAEEAELAGVTIRKNEPRFAPYKLYNIISNGKWRYGNPFLYFTIRSLLKKEKSTHLLIEHPYFGWLAWMIRKTMKITWVVHSHNIEYLRSRSIGRWWWKALMTYEGWVYRNADKVFFISEDDMHHAIKHLGVQANKSLPVTFGVDQTSIPADLDTCAQYVREKYGIDIDTRILLFNGALYHSTNYDALRIILDEINPYLLQQERFRYKVLVCGKGLPDFFNELKDYADKNIIYAGFVDDISVYFKATDVFLNPILSGGGVKTKAIEALAMNCSVVSTPLGALGLKKEVCGDKLRVIDEGKWEHFAEETIIACDDLHQTPSVFYDYYHWRNIVRRAVDFI